MRHLSFKDNIIGLLDNGLKTLFTPAVAQRERPDKAFAEGEMSESMRMESMRLMRVNHCGEICAQALYQGQALFSRDESIKEHMKEAADEEIDHLAWTSTRIRELGGNESILNPLWYGGSFVLGAVAGLVSDKVSLGFVAETENQVSAHLESHLEKLPITDVKSRSIVEQMNIDEKQHASNAIEKGGIDLPPPVKGVMHCFGKIMTKASYYW